MSSPEANRNSRWKDWYPTVVPDFPNMSLLELPYGEPNEETLRLFAGLPVGSTIGDIAGGEGRYALPLANMGYTVVLTDVDTPHLLRGAKKNMFIAGGGSISPLVVDVTEEHPFPDNHFDAALNAGFGYLIPPNELEELFGKVVKAVRPGGLIVFEFATNRDRRAFKGAATFLIGPKEYNYSREEGQAVLGGLFNQHGLTDRVLTEESLHLEDPYYLHSDLLIIAGRRPS